MIKTLDELRQASDVELLEMYKEAQGNTKEFQKKFEVEFSYSSLTTEIANRGYLQGWYKPVDSIQIELGAKNVRKTYTLCEETARKWEQLGTSSTQKNILLSAALEHFMNDYAKGNVDVNVKL